MSDIDQQAMVIGVTPIGGAFPWYQDTIVRQFANSDVLLEWMQRFYDSVDQSVNIDSFYDLIWNIATAEGYGLDVWGRIVCVPRTLAVPTRYFGFVQEDPAFVDPFNVSPFYSGFLTNNNFVLSDTAYRLLILAKALANISAGTIPELNRILQLLFPGRGNCYVVDNLDMSMEYVFEFQLSPMELAIVTSSNVLQHPAGVSKTFSFP